ncbi:hypothetical protein HY620_01310 [Candidatus Uhrbacteria bacterium]|nr:hypothetical protein [Candidatus Uhrbacteria bacterium]
MNGVRNGTHGDDLLRSMANERNFESICATALMRILTIRIDQNPQNTASRKEMRNRLIPLLKTIVRNRAHARRTDDPLK